MYESFHYFLILLFYKNFSLNSVKILKIPFLTYIYIISKIQMWVFLRIQLNPDQRLISCNFFFLSLKQ